MEALTYLGYVFVYAFYGAAWFALTSVIFEVRSRDKEVVISLLIAGGLGLVFLLIAHPVLRSVLEWREPVYDFTFWTKASELFGWLCGVGGTAWVRNKDLEQGS